MSIFYRRDDDVQNGLGEAMPNIAVTYYSSGGGLAAVYANPAGSIPATNPQYTNGLGQAVAYLASGIYTITYSGPQIQTLTYPDQVVSGASGGSGGYTLQIPSPVADGSTRIFTLGIAPTNPTNGLFFVAGAYAEYVNAYTITGNIITWVGAVPPQNGDTLVYYGN